MANLKIFLVPMATAVASLTANSSHDAVEPQLSSAEAATAPAASPLAALPQDQVHRVVFATGSELHALLLVRTEQGTLLSAHQSHASHASHRSHYSGY
jgi:hypothetical protein